MTTLTRFRVQYAGTSSGANKLGGALLASTSGATDTVFFDSPLVTLAGSPLVLPTGQYMPLVVDPDLPGAEELWITSYTGGSGSAPCLRGMGRTGAVGHASNASFSHGPTPPDIRSSADDPSAGDSQPGAPFDYEFQSTSTSLPSGWSWFNQGSAVYQEGLGAGNLSTTDTAHFQVRAIERVLPFSSAYSVYAKLQFTAPITLDPSSNDLFYGGLYFRQSTDSNGNIMSCGLHVGTDTFPLNFSAKLWTGVLTTGGAETPYHTMGQLGAQGGVTPLYLLVQKVSSTNWGVYVSSDGRAYTPVATSIDPTTLGGSAPLEFTPNTVGLFIANHTTIEASVSLESFRVR